VIHLVGQKGQVVIAKEIRDRLGIQPGWRAVQLLVDDHVELRFVPPAHDESQRGALAAYSNVRIPDEETFHQATEAAWARAAREDEPASLPSTQGT